jgi:SAM-dependent methyltransferase
MSRTLTAIWHDVECGAYEADLPLWRELAGREQGPVLELGCGTGRVALDLARRGHRVIGVDADAELLAALAERATGLPAKGAVGDVRSLRLDAAFGLVLAPMQLLQLLPTARDRRAALRGVAAHLRPGGLAAFAIVESMPEAVEGVQPPPDAAEADGWTYSSLPVALDVDGARIRLRRLRQVVSPGGDVNDEAADVSLARLAAGELEDEAAEAGLLPCGRRLVDATAAHVGSTVVLARRPA